MFNHNDIQILFYLRIHISVIFIHNYFVPGNNKSTTSNTWFPSGFIIPVPFAHGLGITNNAPGLRIDIQ